MNSKQKQDLKNELLNLIEKCAILADYAKASVYDANALIKMIENNQNNEWIDYSIPTIKELSRLAIACQLSGARFDLLVQQIKET